MLAAGMVGTGLIVLNDRGDDVGPCADGQYGVDYDTVLSASITRIIARRCGTTRISRKRPRRRRKARIRARARSGMAWITSRALNASGVRAIARHYGERLTGAMCVSRKRRAAGRVARQSQSQNQRRLSS